MYKCQQNAQYVQQYLLQRRLHCTHSRLVTHLSKVFEKIIKGRVVNFLNKYKLISDYQFGFREKISTQDAVLSLNSKVAQALNEGRPSLCVFIDLSKAFDTVGHHLLLQPLEDIGMRGNILKLFESYLTGRYQAVRIGVVLGSERVVNCGLPQGSVLGPTLFNIYVNGLSSLSNNGNIIGFADDTAIFYKADDWDSLKDTVESFQR